MNAAVTAKAAAAGRPENQGFPVTHGQSSRARQLVAGSEAHSDVHQRGDAESRADLAGRV
jgi:hypothetical protein